MTKLTFYTDNCPSTVSFSHEGKVKVGKVTQNLAVGKVNQNLNPNKDHNHKNVSICMLKICGSTIYRPLKIIFK